MKDINDKATVELFETPKKRGRPATGKAKTAAERQAAYRNKKYIDENRDNLNVWIKAERKIKLNKLAEQNGLSLEAMLEKLIYDADYL
jgi:hypothetical protein